MSLRSRAFLSGVGRGFFGAVNARRENLQKRLQEMADNRATMEREHAKSEYMNRAKAASDEETKYQALRSAGDIDDQGNYTDSYFDKIAYAEFKDPNNRAAKGMSFEAFRDNFKKMQPQKFIRSYKSQSELSSDLHRIYNSIDARQRQSLETPVLTGFDRMIAGSIDTAVNKVADVTGLPIEGALSPQEPASEIPLERFSDTPEARVPEAPVEIERPTFGAPKAAGVTNEKPVEKAVFNSDTGELMEGIIRQEVKTELGTTIKYMQRQADGNQTDVTHLVKFAEATSEDVRAASSRVKTEKPRDSFIKQFTALKAANDAFTTAIPSNEGIAAGISSGINWIDTMFTLTKDPARVAQIKQEALEKYDITLDSIESVDDYVRGEESKRLYDTLGYTPRQDEEIDRIVSKTMADVNNLYFVYKAAAALRGDTSKELNTKDIDLLRSVVDATGVKAKQTVFKRHAQKFKISSMDTARHFITQVAASEDKVGMSEKLTFATGKILRPKDPKSGLPEGVAFVYQDDDGKYSTVFLSQSGQVTFDVPSTTLVKKYEPMQ